MQVSILSRRYSSSRRPYATSLDDADFVVEPFDEAQQDFVLRFAVGGDSIPMAINHVGELLVGLQSLLLERRAPVLEKAPRPAFVLVAPELAKGLIEQIGGVETLVGSQQSPQCLPALQGEVLLARQQRVFLALDEAALLPRQTRILALSHLIEGFAQVANDVELVEQDRGLRGVGVGGVAKRLPHGHHGEPDARALLFAKPLIALRHAG